MLFPRVSFGAGGQCTRSARRVRARSYPGSQSQRSKKCVECTWDCSEQNGRLLSLSCIIFSPCALTFSNDGNCEILCIITASGCSRLRGNKNGDRYCIVEKLGEASASRQRKSRSLACPATYTKRKATVSRGSGHPTSIFRLRAHMIPRLRRKQYRTCVSRMR